MTYRISSDYGPRRAPLPGGSTWHAGVDVAADDGTPVHAADDGTVIRSEWATTRGNVVTVDHGDWTTLYQHLHTRAVRVGDTVAAGDVIGTIGSTGLATGPHLHLELRRHGVLTDPAGLVISVMEGKDWFDMATEAQLRQIIREELAAGQKEQAREVWAYKNPRLERGDAYSIVRDLPRRTWAYKNLDLDDRDMRQIVADIDHTTNPKD